MATLKLTEPYSLAIANADNKPVVSILLLSIATFPVVLSSSIPCSVELVITLSLILTVSIFLPSIPLVPALIISNPAKVVLLPIVTEAVAPGTIVGNITVPESGSWKGELPNCRISICCTSPVDNT